MCTKLWNYNMSLPNKFGSYLGYFMIYRKKILMLELPSIVLNNVKRVHYRSKTVLPSLLSQYTAPTVIPSPHGLPPKGRHDTFVIVFHEYLKHVKFK